MKIIRVNVTAKDIEKGARRGTASCPIVLSLKRRFRGKLPIVGTRGMVMIFREVPKCAAVIKGQFFLKAGYNKPSSSPSLTKALHRFGTLPKEAIEFQEAFDRGKLVKPLSFELEVHSKSV